MIWIISSKVCRDKEEENSRYQFIKEVAGAKVSSLEKYFFEYRNFPNPNQLVEFMQCKSDKGEYGFFITSHNNEVIPILQKVLTGKRAVVVINTCVTDKRLERAIYNIVKKDNCNSEIYFATQERNEKGILVNYIDNLGDFGFQTSRSERCLFRNRSKGLIKAIRVVFDKCSIVE